MYFQFFQIRNAKCIKYFSAGMKHIEYCSHIYVTPENVKDYNINSEIFGNNLVQDNSNYTVVQVISNLIFIR